MPVYLQLLALVKKLNIRSGKRYKIQFDKKKVYKSFRFRLFVKLLGIMQLQQLTDEPYKIRVDKDDRRPDLSLATNSTLKQSLINLSSLMTTPNEYSVFKDDLIFCNSEFIQRPDVSFFQVSNLIHYLCTHLFADLPYLTMTNSEDR